MEFKWQPIASAPRDGRAVLLKKLNDEFCWVCHWNDDAWGGYWFGWPHTVDPTHWWPIPTEI